MKLSVNNLESESVIKVEMQNKSILNRADDIQAKQTFVLN